MTPNVIRKIVMDNPSCVMLKHEDWPGLEKISTLRGLQKDGSMRPHLDFNRQWRACSWISKWSAARMAPMTGYAFPDMLIDVVSLSKAGNARRRARPVRCPSAADPL